MDNLTNDAKFLLSSMYSVYIERRKENMNKRQAVCFGNSSNIHETIMPEWSEDDVVFTISELRNNEFINASPGSNAYFHISLTTLAIASLEVTFKDKADAALEFAAKIKNAIPFF